MRTTSESSSVDSASAPEKNARSRTASGKNGITPPAESKETSVDDEAKVKARESLASEIAKKKEAREGERLTSEREAIRKEREEWEAQKKKDAEDAGKAKPKTRRSDEDSEAPAFKWDKPEEGDEYAYTSKAVDKVVAYAKAQFDHYETRIAELESKLEELGEGTKKFDEHVKSMTHEKHERIGRQLDRAARGGAAMVKEKYGIELNSESDFEDLAMDFAKHVKAGTIKWDPFDDAPTADMMLKAWRLENADLIEKHLGKDDDEEGAEEKKAKKETAPKLTRGGARADTTQGKNGRSSIEATLRRFNPGLKES